MTISRHIKISVRLLVESTMLCGSITSMGFGDSKSAEGLQGHKYVQKLRKESYTPEVSASMTINRNGMTLDIGGRIDGVYQDIDAVIIEEIKTTGIPLEFINEDSNQLHWAQAKIYAYIYAMQNAIDRITVRLTYYNRETKEIISFDKFPPLTELEIFFLEIVDAYISWENLMFDWRELRNLSLNDIAFPFSDYRKGQKSFSGEVYKAIRSGGRLFAQAPTGIGKTIAAVFPALKAIGNELISKVFYLTAKTITRTVAQNTLDLLFSKGLRLKVITLTAKEKICFCSDVHCIPEECEFAKGYYDRLREGIKAIFESDRWNREVIEEYAKRFRLCPFEFSLDLSLWADFIICDYNYVFDPRVRLRRFFMEGATDFAFLIDEAHNLVDRGREMYSASLSKSAFFKLMKLTKKHDGRLAKNLKEINRYFIDLRHMLEFEKHKFAEIEYKDVEDELAPLLFDFLHLAQTRLAEKQHIDDKDDLATLYFDVMRFINTCEVYDERYITYVEEKDRDVNIKLFCIDPSFLLRKCLDQNLASIMFSATLTPIGYFRNVLGGDEDDTAIMLTSPFPEENLCLLAAFNVSTRFVNRERSHEYVARYIHAMVSAQKGNYMAYFPSYKYMSEVYQIFKLNYPGINTLEQMPRMNESERLVFLDNFVQEKEEALLGFAVMGGIFGEGIDLTGDRLQGAAIVGVGLPQLCPERDIIREYFQETKNMGFEYAYMYPGMNRVMQAAGRVIRTETDKGVVLLIDERFAAAQYKRLFPKHWKNVKFIEEPEHVIREWGRFFLLCDHKR